MSRNINIADFENTPLFKDWTGRMERIKVVDIGANPVDGSPHYAAWVKTGDADIIGFDPNAESLERLNKIKGPTETYLPYAIGDGGTHTLYVTACQGMSSLLKPNPAILNFFNGFPLWGYVMSTATVDTKRLDDVAETAGVEFLKMDIQGAELMALTNATERLKTALVVEAEVEFLPLYEGQPLFSDVERFMRERGFQLHRFYELASRMVIPMRDPNVKFTGMSQLLWSDAIFIRDLTTTDSWTDMEILKTAIILHDCYRSFDVVLYLLATYDHRRRSGIAQAYFNSMLQWKAKNPQMQLPELVASAQVAVPA